MEKEEEEEEKKEMIMLMGDDVLDDHADSMNMPSLSKSEDVRTILGHTMPDRTIESCAVGRSILVNVLGSIWPPSKLTDSRKDANLPPYPVDSKDGHVYPLKILEKSKPGYVVVSIGWNDIKCCFARSRDPKEVRRMLRENRFRNDLDKLMSELKSRVKKTILVFPNLPRAVRMNKMYMLPTMKDMQTIASDAFNHFAFVAKKYNIPLIDLSRTINPYMGSLYRSDDPTRLSTKARYHVASIVSYAISNHKFDDDTNECVIYSGTGPIRSDRNKDGKFSSTLLEHYLFECKSNAGSGCVVS
jgi:hypothetical protein